MSHLKINKVAFVAVFILLAIMLSGCYTLMGYPPEAKGMLEKRDADQEYADKDYDYYLYDGSNDLKYWDVYDLYYFGNPYYSGRYWYNPWGYGDGYYWHYDGYYIPSDKREVKKRDSSDFGRPERSEQWHNQDTDKSDQNADNQRKKDDQEDKKSPKRERNQE